MMRIQKYEVEKINLVEKVTVSPETYLLPKLLLKNVFQSDGIYDGCWRILIWLV